MSRILFSGMPEGQRDVLRVALIAASLPAGDLDTPRCSFFQLSDDQGPIGFVGIEGTGPDRLLRSLVVLPGRRKLGHGGLLVAHVEAAARCDGVQRLHLLTTTIASFFRARGYRDADRAVAPQAVQHTAQFASLCPAAATYLIKDLT